MATRHIRPISSVRAALLLAVCGLWCVAPTAGGQEAQEQPATPAPTPAHGQTPETRPLLLLVTVVGLQEAIESPVTGATVRIFAEDHEEWHPTDAAGKVTFKFATAAKTVVLRVVADAWQAHQQQLAVDETEKTYKVVLFAD